MLTIPQMNTAAKLLTNDPSIKFHAMHIIFVRMGCTTILGMLYMWYNNIPHFPLGQKGIRGILVLRGVSGFIGIFGIYCKCIASDSCKYIAEMMVEKIH